MKYRINQSVISNFTARDLRARLLNPNGVPRIAIFDLDGTLHRGLCYPAWKGLSNADLSVWLAVLLWREPRRCLAYAKRLMNFHQKWRPTIQAEQQVQPGWTSNWIQSFVNEVLAGLPFSYIERAAHLTSKLCFGDVPFCVGKMTWNSARCAFVSRALSPVLEAYSDRLLAERSENSEIYGNVPIVEDGLCRGLDPTRRVLTDADKYAIVRELLVPLQDRGDAVICGNGAEDLAMFEAAEEVLGAKRCLKVAIKPTSTCLAAAANVVAGSWSGLKPLLA